MTNITSFIRKNSPDHCRVDGPVYDHKPHGWYAPNSVNVRDCVPTYRNSGGGVSEDT